MKNIVDVNILKKWPLLEGIHFNQDISFRLVTQRASFVI